MRVKAVKSRIREITQNLALIATRLGCSPTRLRHFLPELRQRLEEAGNTSPHAICEAAIFIANLVGATSPRRSRTGVFKESRRDGKLRLLAAGKAFCEIVNWLEANPGRGCTSRNCYNVYFAPLAKLGFLNRKEKGEYWLSDSGRELAKQIRELGLWPPDRRRR